jgi:hypothetical protein
VTAFSLGVCRIFNFDPPGGGIVRAVPLFCDNTLKIFLTGHPKEVRSVLLNVVCIQKRRIQAIHHYRLQAVLAVEQWSAAEVSPIEPQQIKRIEVRLTAPEKQIIELTVALPVEADNLTVQNRTPHRQRAC